jgi:CheY-like chemotaxis protein
MLEATTGEEGVKVAKEKVPDLILMDIQFPGVSGIEAFKQMRADAKMAAIPVIAVTASVTPAINGAGFDAFLGKPIELEGFLDTINPLLDRRRS